MKNVIDTVDSKPLSDSIEMDQSEVTSIALSQLPETPATPSLSKSGLPLTPLREELLEFLARNSKAHFKSQHKSEPELSYESKKAIAEGILDHSPAQFLGRFGQYLQEQHLQYFLEDSELINRESYEIGYHLKELKRFYCKATHDVDVRNRRYDAMKKMIAGSSSYFSEDEMRQRNPYLYEQLVGQYLSEEERKEREVPDLENITFVNLLLTKISRDATIELKKRQERAENGDEIIISNGNTESESDDESHKNEREGGTWGETAEKKSKIMKQRKRKLKQIYAENESQTTPVEISEEEKLLLMQEFVFTMYNSFIDGCDEDFDYSQVDNNPDYDCLDVRERDEEEKYFDDDSTETDAMEAADFTQEKTIPLPLKESEEVKEEKVEKEEEEEEEDALDAFMKTVVTPAPTSDISNAFENLCRQSVSQPVEKSKAVKKHSIKINVKMCS